MVREFHPLLDRLPPAQPCAVPDWVALVCVAMAAGVVAVAALLVSGTLGALVLVDEDWRNRIVIVWATAWLLPWPGRPSLRRRMALSSAVSLLVPIIFILSLSGGWFDGLVDLFLPPWKSFQIPWR